MSVDSTDSDDRCVYESYYDKERIDLEVIIKDLLNGNKYEQAQGTYLMIKEQMIRDKVTTTVGNGRDQLTWSVISDIRKEEIHKERQFNMKTGMYG